MSDIEFILYAANNYHGMMFWMLISGGLIYLFFRKFPISGLIDPFHFYYTFTFGTAYGVVISLFLNGFISLFYAIVVFSYGLIFSICILLFSKLKHRVFKKLVDGLLKPYGTNTTIEVFLVFFSFSAIVIIILSGVGFGFLAETNRFEQNRGFGIFVRIADTLRLFLIAYLSITILANEASSDLFKKFLLLVVLIFIMVFSSLLNGSKFAFLEAIYAVFLGAILYGVRIKLGLVKLLSLALLALIFSVFILITNLEKKGFDTKSEARYFHGMPVVAERFLLRILANGNKYYLSLPDAVIEKIEIDSVAVRFLTPAIGTTQLSSILGYQVGDYSFGRQTLLYWYPGHDIHGGPTSHFDLAAYKYFGYFYGLFFVIFIAWLLGSIRYVMSLVKGHVFMSALLASLWLRSLPVLLEPPVGLAYILDVLIIFFLINAIGLIIKKSIFLENAKNA